MSDKNVSNYEHALLDTEHYQVDSYLSLDCRMNLLYNKATGEKICLSESQKRLMVCLINNIHCKRAIIRIVWHECHQRIRDNNYHQLVYQLRNILTKHGFPADTIVTIPHRGIVLNKEALRNLHEDESILSEKKDKKPASGFMSNLRRIFSLRVSSVN
ncbi:hypothetical protein [Pantoea sp. SORGH_AS_0659]|uniref:winged helix-turn-helix domain-containing protein n=1 Tax=Pantoea sp. SORGH_AS_0659 TaxID=3062597 RepID=UPI0028671F41|nr:hypothetical protein [Pantoea sp. SORGH_AS_0659]MDR6352496.1 DNA-binding winged helix-turn-helix (wHTH) protein [Pantoea sp. SORGH_AS_0659]